MAELNPQIPWVLDAEGMATMISPRWQQITGMADEESSGRGFINAVHPEDQNRVHDAIEHSLRTGEVIDVECRVRISSGGWRWIRSQGAPRRDPTARIILWDGSADDIDAQKQLEEQLRRGTTINCEEAGISEHCLTIAGSVLRCNRDSH